MKLDVPDEFLELVVKALENQYALTRALNRDDGRYQEAAAFFRSKLPKSPEEKPRRPRK